MGVAFMGPWIGEFGWELLTWQGFCRAKSASYDKTYVCSFPETEYLYKDFATFIAHNHPRRALDWQDISKVEYTIPEDVTDHIAPFKRYRVPEQKFIKFGSSPIHEFDYLIHARGINKNPSKNYPKDYWQVIVNALEGKGACIGTTSDMFIEGTIDLRGIPLEQLTNYIAGSKVVIGPSSGVMHLATLCGTPIIVWGDKATYFGETLEQRYKVTWNPFNTTVEFLFDDFWKPEPFLVVKKVYNLLGTPSISKPKAAVVPLKAPDVEVTIKVGEGTAKLLQDAMSSGRWFLSVTYVSQNKTLQQGWETRNFPIGDLIPSIEHLKLDMAEKQINPTKLNPKEWR